MVFVKEYPLVDAVEYPKCYRSYYGRRTAQLKVRQIKNDLEIDNETTESIKGVVADLKSAVIKGDTVTSLD